MSNISTPAKIEIRKRTASAMSPRATETAAAVTASTVETVQTQLNSHESRIDIHPILAEKEACDEESRKGHFAWATFGNIYIPYIFRTPSEKYCSVRMVEIKLLSKYLHKLTPEIYCECTCVPSYTITEAECQLLNEINITHCDRQFGQKMFTQTDLIVKLIDVENFNEFLEICNKKLTNNCKPTPGICGLIRINKNDIFCYTVHNGKPVVPLFYFEHKIKNLEQQANYISGWALSYLKFCCKVQGIRNDLFLRDSVAVVDLDKIKSYLPDDTEFKDFWPSKFGDKSHLKTRGGNKIVPWTKQPSAPSQ